MNPASKNGSIRPTLVFNSLHFLIFFPVVTTIYFVLPHRFRYLFLLAASYYFYMAWRPAYILVILFLTWVDYYAARKIEALTDKQQRKNYLLLCLFCNLGILIFFKYIVINAHTKFILNYIAVEAGFKFLNVVLPLGLSFHTFQSMGYVIDVYRGVRPAEKRLDLYALYVAYFPQMVSGPIERSTGLLNRLQSHYDFDYDRIVSGLRLMAWGFFLKLVIADNLAALVDPVYNNPTAQNSFVLLKATYYFGMQIYCDFWGYTEIARGAARVLGPGLMRNFDHPYSSSSVREFWHRWHISLSSWFRDYLYLPLGGNRVPWPRWCFNILLVFMLSGLWHGANWTFVFWGTLHGLYLLASVGTEQWRQKLMHALGADLWPRLHHAWKVFATFQLVSFAWIFFRARTIHDGVLIASHILGHPGPILTHLWPTAWTASWQVYEIIALPMIALMVLIQWIQSRWGIQRFPLVLRWACYTGFVLIILIFGRFGSNRFLYFEF